MVQFYIPCGIAQKSDNVGETCPNPRRARMLGVKACLVYPFSPSATNPRVALGVPVQLQASSTMWNPPSSVPLVQDASLARWVGLTVANYAFHAI